MRADDVERPVPPEDNHQHIDQPPHPKIDVERLAEKVYQLMLAEVRLGRARQLP
jgi:hypothetical protein